MPHNRLACALLLCVSLAWSTTSVAQSAPADDNPAASSESRRDQRIERIRIEDGGSRIDELRVGGETQSIVVSPKGGMPSYDIIPGSANRDLARGERGNGSVGGGGTRVWKVMGF